MNKISKPHIIITGGGGYIGRSLIDFFLKIDCYKLSILTTNLKKNKYNGIKFYKWKLGESFPSTISEVDKKTTLIHLAHEWSDLKDDELNINYSGTLKLFKTAQQSNIKNILFSSSISSQRDANNVYGRIKNRIEDNKSVSNTR